MGPQKHFDIAIAYYKTDDLVLLKESAPVRKADYHNEPQEWMRMARESRAGKHGGIVILNLVMTEHDWDGKSVAGLEPRTAFVDAEVDIDFVDMVVVRTYGDPEDKKMKTLAMYGNNLVGQITKPSSKSYLTFTAALAQAIVQIDTPNDHRLLATLRQREITNPLKLNLVPVVDDVERMKLATGRDKPAIDAQLNVHDIEAAIDDALKQSAKIKRTVVRAVAVIVDVMTKTATELVAQGILLTNDQYKQVYEGSDAWVTQAIVDQSGTLTEEWFQRRVKDDTILVSQHAEVREDVIWPLMTLEEQGLANTLQALYDLQRRLLPRAPRAPPAFTPELEPIILRAQLEREAFCEDSAKLIQQAHARFHAEFFAPTKAQLKKFNEMKVDENEVGHALAARWRDAHAELAAALRHIAIKTLVLRVFSNRVIRMIINKLSDLQAYELDPLTFTEKEDLAKLTDDESATIAAYEKNAEFPLMIVDIPITPNVNVPDPATNTVTFPLPTTDASIELLKWFEEELKDLAPTPPPPPTSPAQPIIAVIPAPPPLPTPPTRPASPVTRAPSPPPTSSPAPTTPTLIPPIPGTPPSTTTTTSTTSATPTTSMVGGPTLAQPEMTNSVLQGLFY
jgi:hypothetical protein